MSESGENKGVASFHFLEASEDAGLPAVIITGNRITVTFPEDSASFIFRVGLRTLKQPSGVRDGRLFKAMAIAKEAIGKKSLKTKQEGEKTAE